MLDAVGFMFFSTLETFAWYTLSMHLFRYNPRDYTWHALFLILIMNLQSYFLRNELSMANYAPLITILIFVALYVFFVRLNIIGALIVTLSGFAGFAVVQTILVQILFGSVAIAQSSLTNGYVLQTATAVIVFSISYVMHRLGYGIPLDFDKLRFRFDDVISVVMMVIFLVIVSALLYYNQIWINLIIFAATLTYLLYYTNRRDRDD